MVVEDGTERRRRAKGIGIRIRQLRLERGMTQAQVAADRFSKAYISALETGIAAPSMRSLDFIAERLRVAPDWFLAPTKSGEEVALPATIAGVRFADDRVYADLDDGRALGLPMSRSRRLLSARWDELSEWQIVERGTAISWPALGEEIGLEDFLGLRMLEPAEVRTASIVDARDERGTPGGRSARAPKRGARRDSYGPLVEWLAERSGAEVAVSFRDLEEILGRSLPPSARRYAGPWSSAHNPLGSSIRRAGWRASPDLAGERVILRRR